MIAGATFYWMVCNTCGRRCPGDDDNNRAWESPEGALDYAADEGWVQHTCPACQPDEDGTEP